MSNRILEDSTKAALRNCENTIPENVFIAGVVSGKPNLDHIGNGMSTRNIVDMVIIDLGSHPQIKFQPSYERTSRTHRSKWKWRKSPVPPH